MPGGRLSACWNCYRPAWSLIAERCVDQVSPLGILFRGEVFQGDGGLFAAGGLFRFHGTLCFWVYGYDLLIGLVRTPKVMRRPLRTFLVGMRSSKRMAGFALAIGRGQAREVSPESRHAPCGSPRAYQPPRRLPLSGSLPARRQGPTPGGREDSWACVWDARCAPLGILRGLEVTQGDVLFLAGGLFRFHGDSVFLVLWL